MKFNFDGYGINFAGGRLKGERFATLMQPGRILSEDERKMYGALMAAAPEMLETLRQFVSLCPSEEGLGGHAPIGAFFVTASKARSAIARATQP